MRSFVMSILVQARRSLFSSPEEILPVFARHLLEYFSIVNYRKSKVTFKVPSRPI